MTFDITILGCGTSTGVPIIGCKCEICLSTNPKNKRLRSSILVSTPKKNILIDTTPDLRMQCLSNIISHIDAIFYTHTHADHVHGIDDLRIFNFLQKSSIPIYARKKDLEEISFRFPYIFTPADGEQTKPILEPHEVAPLTPISIDELSILPFEVQHGKSTVLGFLFNRRAAYITDCSAIPESIRPILSGLEILILDSLRPSLHPKHLSLQQSLDMITILQPKLAVFTHMGHEYEYEKMSRELPNHIRLGYDTMRIAL